MQIKFWRYDLKLTHPWAIATDGAGKGKNIAGVGIIQLTDKDGTIGLGESSPGSRYKEDVEGTLKFFERVDASKLSFGDVSGSMAYVEGISLGEFAAKSALNIALLDGASRRAGKPLYDFLGLGFREQHHVTSFSIGLDAPDIIRQKVEAAAEYPILKLKVGAPNDRENLKALREAAPKKWVRVDANEAWKSREQALEMIKWLADDGLIQFVEQPMPAGTATADLAWLRQRSPLPLFADESYHNPWDVAHCTEGFHGVNVKLCKTGGVSRAHEALSAARAAGLKIMIGCMIETSILISAAAHLAELTDYLDIDGSLLTSNDPYLGVSAEKGLVSFARAPEKIGLRVKAR